MARIKKAPKIGGLPYFLDLLLIGNQHLRASG